MTCASVRMRGWPVDERQHDDAERLPQGRMLEQVVDDPFRQHIAPQFDHHPHPVLIRKVVNGGDAVHFFLLHQIGDMNDEAGLVDLIWQFRHDNGVFAVVHRLNLHLGPA